MKYHQQILLENEVSTSETIFLKSQAEKCCTMNEEEKLFKGAKENERDKKMGRHRDGACVKCSDF